MPKLNFKQKAGVVLTGAVLLATSANAALVPTAIDTADYTAVAGVVLTAAGIFYGIRKALGLLK